MLLAAALALVLASVCQCQPDVWGVPPHEAQRYKGTDGNFKCDDGQTTILLSAINDDYCDCADGTDEPGTSACGDRSTFYCRNQGHKHKVIFSAFVNDGICDCCDGSDEYGTGVCNSTCEELGRAEREERREHAILEIRGYRIKEQMMRKAGEMRQNMTRRVDELETNIRDASAKIETLKAKVEGLKAKVEEERRKAKEESDSRQSEEISTVFAKIEELQTRAEEHQVEAQKGLEGIRHSETPTVSEVRGEDETKEMPSPPLTSNVLLDVTTNEQPMDVSEEAPESEEPTPADETKHEADHAEVESAPLDEDSDMDDVFEDEIEEKHEEDTTEKTPTEKELEEAEKEEGSEADNIESATEELSTLKDALATDYGEGDAFLCLRGECYDVASGNFEYSICPFVKATQNPGSISLGTNMQFTGDPDKHSEITFDKGLICWQGPERSIKINVLCGLENRVENIAEPQKCLYTGDLYTPAACKRPSDETLTELGLAEEEIKDFEPSAKTVTGIVRDEL